MGRLTIRWDRHRDELIVEGELEIKLMATLNAGPYTIIIQPGQTPPPNPLKVTPQSGQLQTDTEGVADSGQVVAVVSGGKLPYNYSAVQGVPSGMELNNVPNTDGSENIVLSGTPDAGDSANSPYSITFTVTDSDTPAQVAGLGKTVAVK